MLWRISISKSSNSTCPLSVEPRSLFESPESTMVCGIGSEFGAVLWKGILPVLGCTQDTHAHHAPGSRKMPKVAGISNSVPAVDSAYGFVVSHRRNLLFV